MARFPQPTEAVYEDSTLRLDQPLPLQEQQRVWVLVMPLGELSSTPDEILQLAAQVYQGLTPAEVDEIESIALKRGDFFGR